ncbi:MAG: DnaB-like helicase C-terminal domain-containing protein [Alphaproteobacteria bacterium]
MSLIEMDSGGAISVDELVVRLREQESGKKLGWPDLDERVAGLGPGDLALIMGRTGHGKTAVLLNLLVRWLEAHPDQAFALFCYELPAERIFLRLISLLTGRHGVGGWPYHEVLGWMRRGDGRAPDGLAVAQLSAAIETFQRWSERLHLVHRPHWTLDDAAAHCRRLADRGPRLGAVLVDHLRLVPPANGDSGPSATARRLRQLGVELRCPVIAAAPVGPGQARSYADIPEGRLTDDSVMATIAKRRPQLHHLPDGSGDQDADLVLGLLNYQADFLAAREDRNLAAPAATESGSAGPFDIAVIKNRNGPLGISTLVLESRTGYIRERGAFER